MHTKNLQKLIKMHMVKKNYSPQQMSFNSIFHELFEKKIYLYIYIYILVWISSSGFTNRYFIDKKLRI